MPADRVYASGLALIEGEKEKDRGADVIAIMTPNDSHFELASAALAAGFDVICDKPMTNTVDEAGRTALNELYDSLNRLHRLQESELAKALGVQIGFNAHDGD